MGDAVGPPAAVDAQMFPILDKGRIADADVCFGGQAAEADSDFGPFEISDQKV